MTVSPLAGKPVKPAMLVNLPKLITAYYTDLPDPYFSGLSIPLEAGFIL